MPRVDMHTHMDAKTQYAKAVETMDQWGGTIRISLAGLFWVKDNNGSNASPTSVRQIPTNDMVYVREKLNDRILFCPGAFTIPSQGIWWRMDEIKTLKEQGFVGLSARTRLDHHESGGGLCRDHRIPRAQSNPDWPRDHWLLADSVGRADGAVGANDGEDEGWHRGKLLTATVMTNKVARPENAVSRRDFLRPTCLATTALGFKPRTGVGAPGRGDPARADASGTLCLWYDRPAETWMTEALPIGNGPMGAMLFGGTGVERVQFNEIRLWSGARMAVEGLDDEGQDLGAYQAFGDILIHLGS